jgi:DNA-binding FadR family transcriptional regulator
MRSYEQVARQIETQILRGDLTPGQKLPTERAMGERFGVSRGVVREAIKVLSTMGLVESRQGSGIYVRNNPIPSISRALTLSVTPEPRSVLRLFEFREEMEALAAHSAALRHTEAQVATLERILEANRQTIVGADWEVFGDTDHELHLAIADASDNPYLYAVVTATRQMQRDVMRLVARRTGTIRTAVAQHTQVVAAIAAGEAEAAAAAMREHMRYSATGAQSVLKQAEKAR